MNVDFFSREQCCPKYFWRGEKPSVMLICPLPPPLSQRERAFVTTLQECCCSLCWERGGGRGRNGKPWNKDLMTCQESWGEVHIEKSPEIILIPLAFPRLLGMFFELQDNLFWTTLSSSDSGFGNAALHLFQTVMGGNVLMSRHTPSATRRGRMSRYSRSHLSIQGSLVRSWKARSFC